MRGRGQIRPDCRVMVGSCHGLGSGENPAHSIKPSCRLRCSLEDLLTRPDLLLSPSDVRCGGGGERSRGQIHERGAGGGGEPGPQRAAEAHGRRQSRHLSVGLPAAPGWCVWRLELSEEPGRPVFAGTLSSRCWRCSLRSVSSPRSAPTASPPPALTWTSGTLCAVRRRRGTRSSARTRSWTTW